MSELAGPGPASAIAQAIIEVPRAVRDALTSSLFTSAEAQDSVGRAPLLHEIVLVNASVARSIAHRYARRGIDLDDLEQIAYLALVRAVSRFDVGRGHDFLAFAVPSIDGEIKRHFRDHGWTIRLPRRLQEVQRLIDRELDLPPETTSEALVDELAHRLSIPPSDIAAALTARARLPPVSLDAPNISDLEGRLVTAWADQDDGASAAEARALLAPLLLALAPRDRRVLRLRYAEERTQQEIAEELGVTQAQVSRILTRIHLTLRDRVADADPALVAPHDGRSAGRRLTGVH